MLSPAVGVVAGAGYFEVYVLRRVLALLAAILTALRRRAVAGLARALVLRPLVRHLNLLVFDCSWSGVNFGLSFDPRRRRSQDDCGVRISDCGLESHLALINPQSEIRTPQ